MNLCCFKHRVLFPLVFLLAVGLGGFGVSLAANMIEHPVARAVQLIKAGNTEESLRQIESKAQQYEVERNWWSAQRDYRVAGLLAESIGNYQKAITYLGKDVEITKKYLGQGEEKERRAREALHLLARAYLAVNDHERALPLIQEALFKFVPDISDRRKTQRYADLQATLGDVYRMKGDLKTALQQHQEQCSNQKIR